jgi:hypothetical protein
VVRLLQDEAARERLAAGGLARYEERFTADALAERAAGALRTIAGAPA